MARAVDIKVRKTVQDAKFSATLNTWLQRKGSKTLGQLQEHFEEKSFAVAFLLLMSLAALPLPTGGITHLLEIVTLLLSVELIIGQRTIWLPGWAKKIKLGQVMTDKALPKFVRIIEWFERFSRPRLSGMLRQSVFLGLIGLVVFALTLTAFLAPPFSGLDTLPALGVVIISLSIILEDIVLLAAGCVVGLAGVGLILSLSTWIIGLIP